MVGVGVEKQQPMLPGNKKREPTWAMRGLHTDRTAAPRHAACNAVIAWISTGPAATIEAAAAAAATGSDASATRR